MKKLNYTLFISMMLISSTAFADLSVSEILQQPLAKIERAEHCAVNPDIARHALPQTPHKMSLPEFGQGIIGWGTGPEGAQYKIETLHLSDIASYKAKAVTLAMLHEWQTFYKNETQRNSCNPTAALRATLMAKIIQMWS